MLVAKANPAGAVGADLLAFLLCFAVRTRAQHINKMADAKVADIPEDKVDKTESDDSDDDVPELEGAENPGKGKQSRGEKKTRKALQKLGLKTVDGITKVTVRKGRQVR